MRSLWFILGFHLRSWDWNCDRRARFVREAPVDALRALSNRVLGSKAFERFAYAIWFTDDHSPNCLELCRIGLKAGTEEARYWNFISLCDHASEDDFRSLIDFARESVYAMPTLFLRCLDGFMETHSAEIESFLEDRLRKGSELARYDAVQALSILAADRRDALLKRLSASGVVLLDDDLDALERVVSLDLDASYLSPEGDLFLEQVVLGRGASLRDAAKGRSDQVEVEIARAMNEVLRENRAFLRHFKRARPFRARVCEDVLERLQRENSKEE